MSQEENNAVALSAFTNGSIDVNPMEENLGFSKKISDGSSCEDDADSSRRAVHTKILKESHVEQTEFVSSGRKQFAGACWRKHCW